MAQPRAAKPKDDPQAGSQPDDAAEVQAPEAKVPEGQPTKRTSEPDGSKSYVAAEDLFYGGHILRAGSHLPEDFPQDRIGPLLDHGQIRVG